MLLYSCRCSAPYAHFIPYAYGTYHTRIVCTICVWCNFVYHTRITMYYMQIACHPCLNAYIATVSLSPSFILLACRYLFNLYSYIPCHHIAAYQWCVPFWHEIHTSVCPLLDGISATCISASCYE